VNALGGSDCRPIGKKRRFPARAYNDAVNEFNFRLNLCISATQDSVVRQILYVRVNTACSNHACPICSASFVDTLYFFQLFVIKLAEEATARMLSVISTKVSV